MKQNNDYGENELIFSLKKGDEKAFESLYEMYGKQIYLKLLRLVKQPTMAEELLQDVFVKVWEKRNGIDERKSFRSYLYAIAQNLAVDLFRKASLDKKMLQFMLNNSTQIYTPIEEADLKKDYEQILQEMLELLPPKRKMIYKLIKIEGKSYDEVSAILHISHSTINGNIVKANAFFKKYFSHNKMLLIALIARFIIS